MIAGRKLLLADDSLAIQKVIDLTFSDEGMEVTVVGDGQRAWEKLDQFAADVVLADVFMPGIDGYGLCELIKQNERFGRIPVILLVGSFEPFDEAEARRVGADDVVTKPFQSIRQLVSRVGSLVSGKRGESGEARQLSTLGLETPKAVQTPGAPGQDDSAQQPNVTVLVEAATMPEFESPGVAEKNCAADIEMQTADTMKLPSVVMQSTDQNIIGTPSPQDNVNETASVVTVSASPTSIHESATQIQAAPASKMNDMSNEETTQPQAADPFNDAFLDLGDFGGRSPAMSADDFILDLEGETLSPNDDASLQTRVDESDVTFAVAEVIEPESYEEAETVSAREGQEWTVVPATIAESPTQPETTSDQSQAAMLTKQMGPADLSPAAIDAIARRVVEQLSDKVVREIAWEVVPELAELLIKKRLDEQPH